MMRRVDPANINPEADLPLFEAASKQHPKPPQYTFDECKYAVFVPKDGSAPIDLTDGVNETLGLPKADGAALRDEGAAKALDAEARKHELAWAIKKAARSFPEFTSDEVRDILAEIGVRELAHPNALSAAILAAAREGIIEEVDKAPRRSTRPEARRRKLTIWRAKAEGRP